ncbi:Sugar (and other) transporter family protein [Candida parapsilosis]|uniref:MFS domain-containing protein n=2 Tax=Candida parapsilosis TaxID=5480 RepID=G8B951_CANPC|nr:uncharacterized protein CPAR2_301390 [Candida parapsilosis]KAF6046089.1 Sugar (and other) transporter family protein [Candida parapsilosis]KAF6046361.1 Sugar (and other) transporter family protein [Candida parapsilosis]KAF6051198.1 Sugar (and other) transporter family protein [Candida parapsilosis]KAF6062079.1 Sugar (and other) transporter family protein [Candida parapsilosis]KAI5903120.1 Sugar transporter STL1 [Candida parapsilosis]
MDSDEVKATVSESEHSEKSKQYLNVNLNDCEDPNRVHTFMGLSGPKLNYAVSIFAGVGFLLFGYDQGVYGSLLSLDSFEDTFPSMKASVNSTLQGAVIAVYELGCGFAALSTVYLGDRLGRLKCMFLGCVIVIIGAALQASAFTVTHLAIARVFTGFGTGYLTSTVPVWSSEMSKAKSRGKLIMMEGSLITLGITISYWVDFGFYFVDKGGDPKAISWRIPVVLQAIFPILLIMFVFKFPESPRWLMAKGRVREARIVFSALYNLPEGDEKITDQLTEIQSAIELEEANDKGFSLKSLTSQGPTRNFHRLSLACWSQIMQQISGINLITYYAGTIFQNYLHMSPFNSRILAACNGTEYFLASLFGILFIERVGRRRLLFWGAVGQSLAMVALTVAAWKSQVAFDTGGNSTPPGVAAAVFLFVFNSVFGMSYLGATWLYPPEISALQLRAPTAALSTASNWAFNFLVVMITPVAFENIQYYTYTIFAVINALMAPAIYFFYPETSGRTLEEMDFIFNQCPVKEPWKVVQIEKNTPRRRYAETDLEKPTTEHIDNVESDGILDK